MFTDLLFSVDLPSITESLYLGINYTDSPRDYNIIVNPENVTYLIRKCVIINDHNYPESNINILLGNGCSIISRIYYDRSDIKFSPYLFRYNSRIVWNGESGISWSFNSGILHMSKPSSKDLRFGKQGESDYLGYLAHQVGVHVYPGPYQDLDLVKIKKGRW